MTSFDDIQLEMNGAVAVIRLTVRPTQRPERRPDPGAEARFPICRPKPGLRVSTAGEHFCARLDLSELQRARRGRSSPLRMWHAAPRCHPAGRCLWWRLCTVRWSAVVWSWQCMPHPCGRRIHLLCLCRKAAGAFCGQWRLGTHPETDRRGRMTDMMLTGCVYNAQDGDRVGFARYTVPAGNSRWQGPELATRIATNAPLTSYALMHALPRIAEQSSGSRVLYRALMAAIAQSAPMPKSACGPSGKAECRQVQKADFPQTAHADNTTGDNMGQPHHRPPCGPPQTLPPKPPPLPFSPAHIRCDPRPPARRCQRFTT